MTLRLALYQPDIPQNTGTLLRLGACLGLLLGHYLASIQPHQSAQTAFGNLDLGHLFKTGRCPSMRGNFGSLSDYLFDCLRGPTMLPQIQLLI